MQPAVTDLVREFDDPMRLRNPELEVELEMDDEMLLDPWFLMSEEEIAALDDDPSAKVTEILLEARAESLDYV